MNQRILTPEACRAFWCHLSQEELSCGTIEKYRRDLSAFLTWAGEREITKEVAAAWKEHLLRRGCAPATVNSMLAVLNRFFKFMGWQDCTVRALRLQRKLFRDRDRELSPAEFHRLVAQARSGGKNRLALLLETIAATGVRVSEVRFITVGSAKLGKAEISLKGKIRTILLPARLCRRLLQYAAKNKIPSGEIFLSGRGHSLSRKQIWAEMKQLCKKAGVAPSKVFPHNLRHLFAMAFYRATKDLAQLADLLGHSSVETTRIYLLSTGEEHLRQLDRLGFVS